MKKQRETMTVQEIDPAQEQVTDYWTGKKWYLVCLGGEYLYVNEARYQKLMGKTPREKPKIS